MTSLRQARHELIVRSVPARSAPHTEQIGNKTCYDTGTMSALLEHTLLEAHDPATGRYDAIRVGQSLGLSVVDMAHLLACSSA